MKILIAGAGPTGLTAAIELARLGLTARIVDAKKAPSPRSRAVGISSHSLDLLEASGVAAKLLDAGLKIKRANVRGRNRTLAAIDITLLRHKYNFLLCLPQNRTEEIMIDVLDSLGGTVEFDTAVKSISSEHGKVLVALEHEGQRSEDIYDIVIGADGIHSTVRQQAGIDFPGHTHPNKWSIADFDSPDFPWPQDEIHLFALKPGYIGLAVCIGDRRYRAIANHPDALKYVPGKYTVSQVLFADDFYIPVQLADTFQKGKIFIAGDAAHVQSPVGARGMNMGIEDACALARRIVDGTTAGYTDERRPVGERWQKRSERMLALVESENPATIYFRNVLFSLVTHIPAVQRQLLPFLMGLRE
ncbi:MAG TPA: NAD(P)/FAD-dependent oxidoreductase [Patescibacteria group bacterium]|nr:NAD(P)/FAD-dependent oxidoreductase [Patescibacteria group bacterium]